MVYPIPQGGHKNRHSANEITTANMDNMYKKTTIPCNMYIQLKLYTKHTQTVISCCRIHYNM